MMPVLPDTMQTNTMSVRAVPMIAIIAIVIILVVNAAIPQTIGISIPQHRDAVP